jgi:phosphoglycerol transferase MdoB-like AlkP superfamily enzyme
MIRIVCLTLLLSIPAISAVILTAAPIQWPIFNLLSVVLMIYTVLGIERFVYKFLLFSVTVVTVLTLNVSFFSSWYLQDFGFNDAFFYHLRLDLFSAGISEFIGLIIGALCLFVSIVALSVFVLKIERKAWDKTQRILALCLLLPALAANTPVYSLLHYVLQPVFDLKPESEQAVALLEYANNKVELDYAKIDKKPNLILIYLESVEQAYFDEAAFPDLMPKLNEIKANSIDFTGLVQAEATSWTIAGTVASQCGFPLYSPHSSSHNNMTVSDDFMGQAVCYGDLVKSMGYSTHFMAGADSKFAGKGKFYKSHHYDSVEGKTELLQFIPKGEKTHQWGLYDKQLMALAKTKFDTLAKNLHLH